MMWNKPEYREAKQDAACRVCDKWIKKGEPMVTWYSSRNRGQNIHIHPACVKTLYQLVEANEATCASKEGSGP